MKAADDRGTYSHVRSLFFLYSKGRRPSTNSHNASFNVVDSQKAAATTTATTEKMAAIATDTKTHDKTVRQPILDGVGEGGRRGERSEKRGFFPSGFGEAGGKETSLDGGLLLGSKGRAARRQIWKAVLLVSEEAVSKEVSSA